MLQQINLYPYLKKPSKIFLNLNAIVVCYIAYILLLLISSVFDASQNSKLEDKLDQASIALVKETSNLNRVKSTYPSVNLADLEGSVKKLKEELKSKNEMFSQLSRQMIFSNYLMALGKAIVPSLWLTDINITQFGKNMTLKGQTTNPALVHIFMQHLHTDPLFSKMDIHLEDISQIPENKKVAPTSSFTIVADLSTAP